MKIASRLLVGSVLLSVLIGSTWLPTGATRAGAAQALSRPAGYIPSVGTAAKTRTWSFIVLGDTRGIGSKGENRLWQKYLATRKCPRPQRGYCPAWRRLVYARVADMLNRRRAALAVHTGDLLYSGYSRPYWVLLEKIFLARLKQRNLFWPAIGNHETPYTAQERATLTPQRPCLRNFHQAFPQLVTPNKICRHTFWTTHRNAAFIFLCTGGRTKGGPQGSYRCPVVSAPAQVAWLRKVVSWVARRRGFDHVFVSWHVPPFTCSKGRVSPGARMYGQAVIDLARQYRGRRLAFTVFNGHEHVTEAFFQDRVLFLVAGGGGAPQSWLTRACHCRTGLAARLVGPPEFRWCASSRRGRIRPAAVNYFTFTVSGRRLTMTEHRIADLGTPSRGWSVRPWGRVSPWQGPHGRLVPGR